MLMVDSVFGGSTLNCIYGTALLIGVLYALFLLLFQGIGHVLDFGGIEIMGHDLDFGSLFDGAGAHIDAHIDVHAGHDIHVGGHDLDGHDGHDANGISMLAISGFTTAFGAFGLASGSLLNASPLLSLAAASVGGVGVGLAAQIFFVQFISQSTSSNIQLYTLKGADAEVTVPIPAQRVGQVSLVISGQRVTMRARSSAGVAIPRGQAVIVDSVREGVAFVSPEVVSLDVNE